MVGVAAIVASLIFVGLQLRQEEEIALSDANLNYLLSRIERNNAIIENSAIWVRGNANDDLNAEDSAVFRAMVLNMNDTAFFANQQLRRMGLDFPADNTVADFATFLHDNPGAWRVWNEREDALELNRSILVEDGNAGAGWAQTIRSQVDRLERQKR